MSILLPKFYAYRLHGTFSGVLIWWFDKIDLNRQIKLTTTLITIELIHHTKCLPNVPRIIMVYPNA